jgi:predicted DNA binding protein
MSRTRLRLDLPADSWLGAAARSGGAATLRVTGTVAGDEGDVTALSVAGPDRADAVATLRDHDRTEAVEVVDRAGAETVVRVTGPPPSYVAAARDAGAPVESTATVADGRATLAVVGGPERLSAFGRRLAAAGATVESTGDDEPDPVLTEAQRELVRAALDAGYYDTPRECTLTELAADRGIAKSTCSETLHRAEGQVLRRFAEGRLGAADRVGVDPEATAAGSADDVAAAAEGEAARGPEVTATEP